MDKLVLIDGNSLLNRAFYATPVFSTKSGNPTNGIFGFVKFILKITSDLKPKYMLVAFDVHAPTFRHKSYELYKATRKPMPAELAAQVEPLKELLKAMNIATCEKAGLEADDIVGTLSHCFDVHSYIYTGDRDSYQLVDEKTDVHFTKSGVSDLLKLNKDNFREIVGLEPKQIVDLKALMGDKSDNIPGIPGVGEKTAMGLLQTYGSLDGIYAHAEELKGALKEKVQNNKELAYLSYDLATIRRDCELSVKLEDCVLPEKYSAEVKRMFMNFEFRSLLNLNVFDTETVTNEERVYPELIECKSFAETAEIIGKSNEFFIEKTSQGFSFYAGDKQYCVNAGIGLLEGIRDDQIDELLRSIFTNGNNHVVAYDYKSLLHDLARRGIECSCDLDDVSVMKYITENTDKNADLKAVCEFNGYEYKYCAFALSELYSQYLNLLKSKNEEKLYYEIEKPLVKVLFDMERAGVKVDTVELERFAEKYNGIIKELSEKIYSLAGCEFNINSPSQLGEILFVKLGLKAGKKSKRGTYSTSADILEKLAADNEIVRLILKFRQYQKLLSTYVDGIRPLIDKTTKKVHTTYNQTVTTTGRLSSTNPNLQNIPIREEEGKELRKLFVPADGNIFIDADYSQIELRLLAHFSGCKELIDAFNADEDIHASTAAKVFGVKKSEVTDKMRRTAKAVNFGIIYGISDYGLSNNLNISVSEAAEIIKNYFATYSAVKEYMDSNVEFARKNGYVSTLTGRKRFISEISSSNYNLRQFGERAAMNMPLQGSSADIIKIAMINVHDELKRAGLKTKLILQVHDELILDAPINEKARAAEILKNGMENAVSLKVPLKVEVHCGGNWYEAK